MKNFNTIKDGKIFTAEYEVKKSVFIAHVRHVETEEAAREFVQSIKKKYFDATHNCSAWVLGEKGDKQKSNDDGEPGGTAGNPILGVIQQMHLTNTCVVVTRYFGGIKLGAGGLIRAYGRAAVSGIIASEVVQMIAFQKIAVTIEYSFLAQVENFLRNKNITVADIEYAGDVTLNILIEPAAAENFLAELTELTAANFLAEVQGEVLMPVDV